ncbi:hypothetical protein [Trueperella abortisuis]|uniref:hypothetical protein n=1 Tax=Trueperella abortisuis TaxID=445930 RepID=UPI002892FAB2|nr:hypothetical protein [Trueperella abortisuis]
MPEIIFTPWPLAPGCAPRLVPPGQFYYHVGTAPLSLWLDTLFSEDLLMQEDTYSSWIGPTFTVWDDDGVVRLDATLFREPYAADNQVLGRYVVTTDTWRQEPTDSDLGNLTAKIAATLHEHAGDTPAPLEPGEVAVVNDHHPWPTIHTSTGNALMRFIEVDYDLLEDQSVAARRFNVFVEEFGDSGSSAYTRSLIVRPDTMILTSRFGMPLRGDALPPAIRDLREVLWNDGRRFAGW